MSDQTPILKVENLTKTYSSNARSQKSIKDFFTPSRQESTIVDDAITALNNVSFELKKGECLGIIGSNGAGKSTLLKVLSGITSPTAGKITVGGRVLSVLDIGTGFHPDLTGRENVYLNGEILGMSKPEIQRKYEEIVAFSEIGNFIDRPVKHYSSGMYLRLAFSIVINMDADILLFDEVLAVGDASFKQKCQRHIRSLPEKGKSVIMVSHNMTDMLNYCNRVILLDKGTIIREGASHSIVSGYTEHVVTKDMNTSNQGGFVESRANTLDEYLLNSNDKSEALKITAAHRMYQWNTPEVQPSNNYARLRSLNLQAATKDSSADIYTSDQILLDVKLDVLSDSSKNARLAFQLMDATGIRLFNSFSSYLSQDKENTAFSVQAVIPPNLFNEGLYQMIIAIFNDDQEIIYFSDFHDFYFKINLDPGQSENVNYSIGPLKPLVKWQHFSIR